MASEPKTLQAAILYFASADNCLDFLAVRRWPEGVICPTCGSKEVRFLPTRLIWECKAKHAKKQFSIKVGSIFEDSAIGLDKWLTAIWMIANCKNGISSYEIHRALGVTQKTAWFMLHRIRVALRAGSFEKMGGGENSEIEIDETFIGGKMSNMHAGKRKLIREAMGVTAGSVSKTVVMGFLDREQRKVRTAIVPNTSRQTLQAQILKHVVDDSNVYTDEAPAYLKLPETYVHEIVNHAQQYVRGRVHTNGLENFWSLLKRGLNGTYVAVEPFHLFRYLDEQMFRYNNRGTRETPLTDADRFDLAVRNLVGRRLTYKELTGKEGETAF
jgi:transposase-like protein